MLDLEQAKMDRDDAERSWKELEQLFPHIFLHRSPWQRLKDAFRRSGATVAPAAAEEGQCRAVNDEPLYEEVPADGY